MHIGIPKEIKNNECRVAIVPSIVRELTEHGHQVFIETNAGLNISRGHIAHPAVARVFDKPYVSAREALSA